VDGSEGLPQTAGYLKLARGRHHVDQLKDDIDAYLAGKPYEVAQEAVPGGLALRLRVHTSPPATLGLVAGDAVHNLRSALDAHLVTLAEDLCGRLSEKQERCLQVPAGKDKLAQETKGWDKYLGAAVASRLRQVVEPLLGRDETAPLYWAHRHGSRPEDERELHQTLAQKLRRLTWLSNVDKHRRVHLPWMAPGSLYATAATDDEVRWAVQPPPLSDGGEVARVVGASAVDDFLVSAHASLTLCLPGEPASPGVSAADELEDIGWFVGQALRVMDFAVANLGTDEA
jgi:hypothetical protein